MSEPESLTSRFHRRQRHQQSAFSEQLGNHQIADHEITESPKAMNVGRKAQCRSSPAFGGVPAIAILLGEALRSMIPVAKSTCSHCLQFPGTGGRDADHDC
jgi:hypothetical protein